MQSLTRSASNAGLLAVLWMFASTASALPQLQVLLSRSRLQRAFLHEALVNFVLLSQFLSGQLITALVWPSYHNFCLALLPQLLSDPLITASVGSAYHSFCLALLSQLLSGQLITTSVWSAYHSLCMFSAMLEHLHWKW